MKKRILISGFEPFDGLDINPSAQLLEYLSSYKYDFELSTILLPVSFPRAFPILKNKIEEVNPQFVIMTGLAKNRQEITPEKIAINFINARNPDNEGNHPKLQKIEENGIDGLFSTLPTEEMIAFAKTHHLPVSFSFTAGTYVCNDLFYKTLSYTQGTSIRAGFIHLPATEEILPEGNHLPKQKLFETFSALLKNCF